MPTRPPNILFLFPDQHRPDWLGRNAALPLRTPQLDRLAARGVQFNHACTPSPVCSPARACLATGRDYPRCGVRNNGQNTPLTLPTYYGQLRDAGYDVAGVGKFDLHKPDCDWGLDGSHLVQAYGFTRGIDNEGKGDAIASFHHHHAPRGPYMQFLQDEGLIDRHLAMYAPYLGQPGWLNYPAVTTLPEHAYCDNWVAGNALRFLRDFSPDRPWHLVVNFVGPHGPFDVTPAMHARWEDVDFPPPIDNDDPDQGTVRLRQQHYAAMIENIDVHVGRMLALVEARGELDNTLVVYASDHGEMLGDHNRWGKSVWYTPSAGIPLIVAGPGVRQGVSSDALVALHDLAATFLEMGGAAPLPDSDARSLRPVLTGETEAHREYVFSQLGNWTMCFDGRYKLVLEAEKAPALYDLREDPRECRDIAAQHPEIVHRLRNQAERE
jgi:arylsulfatase A-like enzyme